MCVCVRERVCMCERESWTERCFLSALWPVEWSSGGRPHVTGCGLKGESRIISMPVCVCQGPAARVALAGSMPKFMWTNPGGASVHRHRPARGMCPSKTQLDSGLTRPWKLNLWHDRKREIRKER